MKIECLTKRAGVSPVFLDKTQYIFQPVGIVIDAKTGKVRVPKDGEQTTSICEINSDEHVAYLLARPNFRKYDPEILEVVGEPLTKLVGFQIDKYGQVGHETGYCIIDRRKKGQHRYIGSDGTWRPTMQGVQPFNSMIDAYSWLIEESEMGMPDEDTEDEQQEEVDLMKLTVQELVQHAKEKLNLTLSDTMKRWDLIKEIKKQTRTQKAA